MQTVINDVVFKYCTHASVETFQTNYTLCDFNLQCLLQGTISLQHSNINQRIEQELLYLKDLMVLSIVKLFFVCSQFLLRIQHQTGSKQNKENICSTAVTKTAENTNQRQQNIKMLLYYNLHNNAHEHTLLQSVKGVFPSIRYLFTVLYV